MQEGATLFFPNTCTRSAVLCGYTTWCKTSEHSASAQPVDLDNYFPNERTQGSLSQTALYIENSPTKATPREFIIKYLVEHKKDCS